MDRLIGLIVRFMVFLSKHFVTYETWDSSQKLKILLVGYNGARNTGADVRVVSLVDQIEELFALESIEISVMTLETEDFGKYFKPHINLISFSSIFFVDLLKACSSHHMAILCEGSTLKSKFANSLTMFFCQAAGIMKAQGKPCLAYGSEAGDMDPFVSKLAQKLCSDTYFIARTQNSLQVIRELGLKGHLGTDTAWTFESESHNSWVRAELEQYGWNGKKKLIGIAVINPFWWPVRPSLPRLIRSVLTRKWNLHFQKWYYFSWSKARERSYNAYVEAIAQAVTDYVDLHDAFPVIIGMEQLDDRACVRLQTLLKEQMIDAPLFVSHSYDGKQLSALLRNLSLLVTSRYHAHVLSMDAAVPTVAISMDERLTNLVSDIGLRDQLLHHVTDDDLAGKISKSFSYIDEHVSEVRQALETQVKASLSLTGDMGYFFVDYVQQAFPGFAGIEQVSDKSESGYQFEIPRVAQGLPYAG